MTDLPEIREGLVVRPGDTIIFTVQDHRDIDTPEKLEDFSRRVHEALKVENINIVFTDPTQVTLTVIRKEEAA